MDKARAKQLVRRILPWALGLAIVAIIAARVPYAAFAGAIAKGPHLVLALVDAAVVVGLLAADTLATWIGLRVLAVRWGFKKVLEIRGATYLLSLLNYAVGQGGIGYYLHREGVAPLRAVGMTLFLMGTTFATLLVVTTTTWASHGATIAHGAMWWTLVAGMAAFVVYLVAVALSPAFIARRDTLAVLFEAGVRGHAIAMLARLPHVALIVLGHWFAMLAWGIHVPFLAAVTVMPAVVIATVLPISPAGLGTTQAALVFFFADYAAGTTGDDRSALVLAFSIVHFVYAVIGQALVGLGFILASRRAAR